MQGKKLAIIIDHVGNYKHGVPDYHRNWTLERRVKKQKSETILLKNCPQCTRVFERFFRECPYCGYFKEPAGRSTPEQVDGDLMELDRNTILMMQGQVDKIDLDPEKYREFLSSRNINLYTQVKHVSNHIKKQEIQKKLRHSIALWSGFHKKLKRTKSQRYRLFYLNFGIDVLSAKALNINEAEKLNEEIVKCLKKSVN